MADWYSYYETATGALISTGTVRPGRVRAGITEVFIGTSRPGRYDIWNPTTRQFEDRETEVKADLAADLAEEATLRSLYDQAKAEEDRLAALREGRNPPGERG